MVNCTYSDVRLIIDTGLTDANLTSLIVLADGEMATRDLTGSPYTSDLKKQISMLITASIAAMNDVKSEGKAGYAAEQDVSGRALVNIYRRAAEALIASAGMGNPRARLG